MTFFLILKHAELVSSSVPLHQQHLMSECSLGWIPPLIQICRDLHDCPITSTTSSHITCIALATGYFSCWIFIFSLSMFVSISYWKRKFPSVFITQILEPSGVPVAWWMHNTFICWIDEWINDAISWYRRNPFALYRNISLH